MVTDTRSNGFWIMKKTGNGYPTRISIWSMPHMAIPITGCEEKRPFLVLWRGLICTVNIRMENTFKKWIIGQGQGFLSLAEVQKMPAPLVVKTLVAGKEKRRTS